MYFFFEIMVIIDGYKYQISTNSRKKLQVFVNNRWIHFGQVGYQHFFDRTGLLNKHLNHEDPARRQRYLARASKITKKDGSLAARNVNSANYHAIKILW